MELSLLKVAVEHLSLVLDDFLNVALLRVVHLDLLDAVVSPQVALEVVGEEVDQLPQLLSIAFQIGQYFRNKVIQLLR